MGTGEACYRLRPQRRPGLLLRRHRLAHNVRTRDEVDGIVERAAAAGATVTREPAATIYGGHAGCFRDPDGHTWEIAHNHGFTLEADGSLTLSAFGDGG